MATEGYLKQLAMSVLEVKVMRMLMMLGDGAGGELESPKDPPCTPPPPPRPPGTFHYDPKMYLRVSRTQSHLFPGQPLG